VVSASEGSGASGRAPACEELGRQVSRIGAEPRDGDVQRPPWPWVAKHPPRARPMRTRATPGSFASSAVAAIDARQVARSSRREIQWAKAYGTVAVVERFMAITMARLIVGRHADVDERARALERRAKALALRERAGQHIVTSDSAPSAAAHGRASGRANKHHRPAVGERRRIGRNAACARAPPVRAHTHVGSGSSWLERDEDHRRVFGRTRGQRGSGTSNQVSP